MVLGLNNNIWIFNPLPHGVLATFSLTAWGFMGPPKKDDISNDVTADL